MNINKVSKSYNNTSVLDNISFNFKKGEIIGLVGRNGAGKSTLMKIITENILNFNGSIMRNSSIGYLIEEPKLIASMSGLEHLIYFSRIYGNKFDINEFKDLLVSLNLYQILNKKVREYSLGMKQKLAVVISILNYPDYVVLDEPTNGMDVESSYEMLNALKKLAIKTDLGILISSHKLEDIEIICDRILFLENGVLIGEETINQSSQNIIKIIFSNNDDLTMFINKQELGNIYNVTQDTLTLQTSLNSSDVFTLLEELNIFIIDCHTEKNTLRNIYLDKFGGEKMKFNITGYVSYNLKRLITRGYLPLGLMISILPASIMCYIILVNSAPFTIKHISNFYCMLGITAMVLQSTCLINNEFYYKTISLIYNSKENRLGYIIGNILISIFVGAIFSAIGIILFIISKYLGVPGELEIIFLLGFILDVILVIVIYFLCGYCLFLSGFRSGAVYGILILFLLFIPNLLSNIVYGYSNPFLSAVVENFPGYYLPITVGSNVFTLLQYIISLITIFVLFTVVLKKVYG